MSELLKSRHAFGSEANIDSALDQGLIDAYDILFLKEGKIGWIDADGNKVILEDKKQVVSVDALPEIGEVDTVYIWNAKFYFWNGSEFIPSIDEIGVTAEEVDSKISSAITNVKNEANTYTNKMIETVEAVKYEITDVPVGTLVNYSENEIRVMCPQNSEWMLQNVGTGGDPNCYYCTFKTYVPNNDVVGYIEHLGDKVDSEILTNLYTDEYGRRYQPTWLALAKYDEATDVWTYYGSNSTANHYIGWDYQIDWYNANGVMIASDSIRINLSNEECRSSAEPYYVSNAVKTANAYTDKQIADAVAIIEF